MSIETKSFFFIHLLKYQVCPWLYFSTQIKVQNDEWAKETVELGDIAFWPPGNALCLFFGSTPISASNEIRPASATNIMGKLKGDLELLKNVKSGDNITVRHK